jgi:8-oxo-dGTP pyrophosphatase MutT (NUDIX family)
MNDLQTEQSHSSSWILEIRSRLSAPVPRRLPPSEERQAAVLVPLYVDAGELWTVLTKRSDSLPHHRGQIAFPGGSAEPGEDSWDAALRESEEEIGLASSKVLRLGELDETETPSGFRIVPCVGAVPYPMETRLAADEVEEIFAVPISAFTNPRMVEHRVVTVDGQDRELLVYHIGGRQVWGLTARIVQMLLVRLGLEVEPEEAN